MSEAPGLEALKARLAEAGISLQLEAGQLKVQAPKGALTPELRAALAAHKAALLAELGGQGPIPPWLGDRPAPLSFAQERLWFLAQLQPGDAAYHVPVALRLEGALDREALATALGTLLARHEALRTRIEAEGGRPRQRVLPPPHDPPPLPCLELGALAPEAQAAAHDEALRELAEAPFDLARGGPWRALLIARGPERHTLAICLHHLVADAWSCGLLAAEWAQAYAAALGLGPALPPLRAATPSAHAQWQRQRASAGPWREALAARVEALRGLPALALPRGEGLRPGCGSFTSEVPAAQAGAIAQQAAGLGMSPFAWLLGAIGLLLGRLSGQRDFALGVPVAGRDRLELEGTVACLVNAMVVRVRLEEQPRLPAYLKALWAEQQAAQAAADLPFEALVEALAPPRVPGQNPLFQAAVVQQPSAWPELALPGLRLSPEPWPASRPKFPLAINLQPLPEGGWRLHWEHDLACHDGAQVQGWAQRLALLVGGMLAEPEAPVLALPFLLPGEAEALRAQGQPRRPLEGALPPPLAFWAQAQARPEAIALVEGELRLSYGALAAAAGAWAAQLQAQGLGPGQRVGLALPRSAQAVCALLAIQLTGAAYVPFHPEEAPGRQAQMEADAELSACLRPGVAWPGWGAQPPEGWAPHPASPEDLAYLIYTSGSTGAPKAVAVAHRQVARLLEASEAFAFGPQEVWSLAHALAFDFSVWELWGALALGGRLVVVPQATAREPKALAALLRAEGVTVLNQTPSAFQQLMPELSPPASALRWVIFGGEALRPTQLFPWWEAHPPGQGPRLVNMYGITETTVHVTFLELDADHWARARAGQSESPIGHPLPDLGVLVLDEALGLVPVGTPGELGVVGAGLAQGYWRREALSAERFLPNPHGPGRLYRSGDLGWRAPEGGLHFLGRADAQVKVRGHRIELGEIEAALRRQPGVQAACAGLMARPGEAPRLVAHVVPQGGPLEEGPWLAGLAQALREALPPPYWPSAILPVPDLPLNANGKLDRARLPWPSGERPELAMAYVAPRNPLEAKLAGWWAEALGLERVGVHDGFFELGGHSLLLPPLVARIEAEVGKDLPMALLFRHPTVAALAAHLEEEPGLRPQPAAGPVGAGLAPSPSPALGAEPIAVIGMACRFPGAEDLEAYWRLLEAGGEAVVDLDEATMRAAGATPEQLQDPRWVRRGALMVGVEDFDPAFFGFAPAEAASLDPQLRWWLMVAWEALAHAGVSPGPKAGGWAGAPRLGIYGGASLSRYLLFHLAGRPELVAQVGELGLLLGNDKDHVVARSAYALDARGPVVAVATACSTGLVAIHEAAEALRRGDCEVALAGGVSIETRQGRGYPWQAGGIGSEDGRCRPFDAAANGTVGGSGVGLVVLKRLAQAQADGDTVHAVLLGSAVGNDGANKAGYTAPGPEGQAEVLRRAWAQAGAPPALLGALEAHGTGTALGDPVELLALQEALGAELGPKPVSLGSVKGNLGHLDAAAGVAGFLKAVLMLRHRRLVPSLQARGPKPGLPWGAFRLQAQAEDWAPRGGRWLVGVSAFGLGGTNAHAVLEAAPAPLAPGEGPAEGPWVVPLSAKDPASLAAQARAWAQAIADSQAAGEPWAPEDWAHTAWVGRARFPHRAAARWPAGLGPEAAQAALLACAEAASPPPRGGLAPIFLIPGLGAQRPGGAASWHRECPPFREAFDRAGAWVAELLGEDLRPWLLGPGEDPAAAAALLRPPAMQAAIALVAWSTAQAWLAWGLQPVAIVGHSLGELIAAALAGLWEERTLFEAVVARGRAMEACGGATLLVAAPAEALRPWLGPELHLASDNGPASVAISGSEAAIAALEARLGVEGLGHRRLAVPHQVHSPALAPAAEAFAAALAALPTQRPRLPFWSGAHGAWADPEAARAPGHWAHQLQAPMQLGAGLAAAQAWPGAFLIDLGPSQGLWPLAQALGARGLASHARQGAQPGAFAAALAELWCAGAALEPWPSRGRRRPAPGHPWRLQRVGLPPTGLGPLPAPGPAGQPAEGLAIAAGGSGPGATSPGAQVLHPHWRRLPPLRPDEAGVLEGLWCLYGGPEPWLRGLEAALRARGAKLRVHLGPGPWPAPPEGAEGVLLALDPEWGGEVALAQAQAWARSWRPQQAPSFQVLAGPGAAVWGLEELSLGGAQALGAWRCWPHERPELPLRLWDWDPASVAPEQALEALLGPVGEAPQIPGALPALALRGPHRWACRWEALASAPLAAPPWGGTWLITGAFGGLGSAWARHLAANGATGLILLGRPGPVGAREQALLTELEGQGLRCHHLAIDLAQGEALRGALEALPEGLWPLAGVVHAAGVPGGRLLAWRESVEAERVAGPKLAGTEALAIALQGRTVGRWLLFGALTSLLGGPGQADYASANAALGPLAHRLRARGEQVLLVHWAPWRGVGMSALPLPQGLEAWGAWREAWSLAPEGAIAALERALGEGGLEVAIAPPPPRGEGHLAGAPPSLAPGLATPPGDLAPRQDALRVRELAPEALPQGPLEEAVAALWRECLGLSAVGREEGFFELGGHSLMALRLVQGLEALAGGPLPLEALMEAGTVAGMARLVAEGPGAWGQGQRPWAMNAAARAWRPGAAGPGTFLLPGAGGWAFPWRAVAAALPAERPVWALAWPAAALALAAPSERLAAVAEAWAAQIGALVPEGPVALGGWSVGALALHELASRLAGAGRGLGPCVAVDMACLAQPELPPEWVLVGRMGHELLGEEAASWAWDEGSWAALQAEGDPWPALWQAWGALRPWPPGLDAAALREAWGRFLALAEAQAAWAPQAREGELQLFLAEQGPFVALGPTGGWGPWVGAVAGRQAPGDHQGVLSRGAEAIAAALAGV